MSAPTSRAIFVHGEGEPAEERLYKIRMRGGKAKVSVQRTAGTAAGRLTVYRSDEAGVGKTRIDSKTWSNESADVISDLSVSFPFIFLGAEFSDSDFGQVEVLIQNG